MTRSLDTPYYYLFNKSGRRDIYFALKHYGLDLHLIREIISHTWFGVKFRVKKFSK